MLDLALTLLPALALWVSWPKRRAVAWVAVSAGALLWGAESLKLGFRPGPGVVGVILGVVAALTAQRFVGEHLRIAATADPWGYWSPGGWLASALFRGTEQAQQVVLHRVHQKPHAFAGAARQMITGGVFDVTDLEGTFGAHTRRKHRSPCRSRPYLCDDLLQSRDLQEIVVHRDKAPVGVVDRAMPGHQTRCRWFASLGVRQDILDLSTQKKGLQLLRVISL